MILNFRDPSKTLNFRRRGSMGSREGEDNLTEVDKVSIVDRAKKVLVKDPVSKSWAGYDALRMGYIAKWPPSSQGQPVPAVAKKRYLSPNQQISESALPNLEEGETEGKEREDQTEGASKPSDGDGNRRRS